MILVHLINDIYKYVCSVIVVCELVLTDQMLKKQHSSGERRHGKKDQQPSPEPVTYALLQSFSHASYKIGHTPSSWHIRGNVGQRSVANSVARVAETP